MKKVFLILIFSVFIINLFAQPAIQWKNNLGGSGNDFARFQQQTNDGGYIIAGYTNSSNGDVSSSLGNFDMWALKIDLLGSIQWEKSVGGSGLDAAYSAAQTADN